MPALGPVRVHVTVPAVALATTDEIHNSHASVAFDAIFVHVNVPPRPVFDMVNVLSPPVEQSPGFATIREPAGGVKLAVTHVAPLLELVTAAGDVASWAIATGYENLTLKVKAIESPEASVMPVKSPLR